MNKETYIGIVEMGENVIYITKDDNYIYSNGCTNAGQYHLDEYEIDSCFSLDENLQAFIELLEGVENE